MMLSDVCRVHPGGVCGRPAGWRVLADRARLGRPGSRLPLRASVAGLGGAYRGGRPPTACFICCVSLVECPITDIALW